ncbi:MAG TPA: hypothetical protein VF789_11330 [Thermoanaerobaculia bacterium]
MKITITLPDEIGERVSQMPDPDEFVAHAVAQALERRSGGSASAPGRSRWAQVVKRIESRSKDLGGFAEELKRSREDFRRNFHFRHDEP